MKQTIGNACGTIGILHSLINSNIQMNDGSIIAKFLADCNGKTGEEIGKMLEESHEIANLHKVTGSSSANQTQADETTQVHDHFVALVHVDGSIYEVSQYWCSISTVLPVQSEVDNFSKFFSLMDVKIVQFVTVHHLPKLLYPMPPKFVKSSSALIQKVRNSLLLHFQIALERHNAHRNRPTESFAFYFCNILHVQFFKSITILGYKVDNVLFLE